MKGIKKISYISQILLNIKCGQPKILRLIYDDLYTIYWFYVNCVGRIVSDS